MMMYAGVAACVACVLLHAGGTSAVGQTMADHTLARPYISQGVSIPYWHYGKNTIVSDEHIRLTSDRQSQIGYVWNTVPLYQKDWDVVFEYKVHGQGERLYGDGFAFWLLSRESFLEHSKQNNYVGPVFGGPATFDGMLVSFDTYRNGNYNHMFPWIGLMHGTKGNVYSPDDDNKENELDGCLHRFRNRNEREQTKIRIIYMRGTVGVYTSITPRGLPDMWEECILVTDIWLPEVGFFGFTALTGDVADNHDILHFNARWVDYASIPQRQRDAMQEAEHRPPQVDPVTENPNVAEVAAGKKPVEQGGRMPSSEELKARAKWEHSFRKTDRHRRAEAGEGYDTFRSFILYFLKIMFALCGLVAAVVIGAILYNRKQSKQSARRFT